MGRQAFRREPPGVGRRGIKAVLQFSNFYEVITSKEVTMSMIVKIQWENGKPCSGTRVLVWIEGQGNKEVHSDQNGEAYFDYGPGSGTIYCDGQEVVRERSLSRRELITCESSGLFSYSYY